MGYIPCNFLLTLRILASYSSNKVTTEFAVTQVPGYISLNCHSEKLAKVNFDLAVDVSKAVARHKISGFFVIYKNFSYFNSKYDQLKKNLFFNHISGELCGCFMFLWSKMEQPVFEVIYIFEFINAIRIQPTS